MTYRTGYFRRPASPRPADAEPRVFGPKAKQQQADTSGDPAALHALTMEAAAGAWEKVAENLAQNPNTPADDLHTIAEKFPRSQYHVAGNPQAQARTIRLIITAGGQGARRRAVTHTALPVQELEPLLHSTDDVLRERIARRDDLPAEFTRVMITDTNANVRRSLVYRTATPDDVYVTLLSDPDYTVREKAANNIRNRSTAVIAQGAALNPLAARRASDSSRSDRTFDEATLLELARSTDKWARVNVAERPDLTDAVFEVLVADKDLDVRSRLAGQPGLGQDRATRLAAGRAMSIVRVIAGREDFGYDWLVAHGDPKVRLNAVEAVPLAAANWHSLLHDPDLKVRTKAAAKGAPTHELVAHLVDDPAWQVRVALAGSALTSITLDLLSLDTDHRVRAAVMTNRHAGETALDRGVRDPIEEIRVDAAKHANTAPATLLTALDDPSFDVRRAALRAKQVNDTVLAKAATDTDPEIRMAAVNHRALSSNAIAILLNDPVDAIRERAGERFMRALAG